MAINRNLPTRSLGSSGLQSSAIGLGCMSLSGTYGASNDEAGIAVIREALDRGITLLDTGDFHGELGSVPGFAWPAEYAHDPSLYAFYENDNNRAVMAISRSQHGEGASDPVPGLLDLVCCTRSRAAPPGACGSA